MTTAVLDDARTSNRGRMTVPGQPDIIWDTTDQASVDAARETFTKLTTTEPRMHAATATRADAAAEVEYAKTDVFDPTAAHVVFWRQIQGG